LRNKALSYLWLDGASCIRFVVKQMGNDSLLVKAFIGS